MKIFYYKLHKDREVLVIQEPEEKYLLVQINIVLLAFKKSAFFAITKLKAYVGSYTLFNRTNVIITF